MKITIVFNVLHMAVTPLMALFSSCKDEQPWDELPVDISRFISQYFPNCGIESFTTSPTTYHIRISNGPSLTFDKDYRWESINGYGMPLPEVLLYDRCHRPCTSISKRLQTSATCSRPSAMQEPTPSCYSSPPSPTGSPISK